MKKIPVRPVTLSSQNKKKQKREIFDLTSKKNKKEDKI